MPARTISRARFRAALALLAVLILVGLAVTADTPRQRYLALGLGVLGLMQAVREWRRGQRG
ncbi:MAG TPA: hypothetical protein VD948_13525 [Rhodothermales bacterium]|nr:hypothetical protein [Rhodothermales bacterium]